VAPPRDDYHHASRSESNASAHLQNLLLHHQVLVSLTDAKLELARGSKSSTLSWMGSVRNAF